MSFRTTDPARRRAPRGFTLIELLMVVAIFSVLAALIMPKVRVDNAHVDTAARLIGMSLMSAQRDAASRQHNVLVLFDTAAHLVKTVWDVNNNGNVDSGEKTRLFLIPDRVVLGRPAGVGPLGTATSSVPLMKSNARGPYLIVQRNGAVDRSVTLYVSTIRAMKGGKDKDSCAVIFARATGRPDWYAWTGTKWRRGL